MAGTVDMSPHKHAQTHTMKAKNDRIGDSHSKQLLEIFNKFQKFQKSLKTQLYKLSTIDEEHD